MRRAMLAVYGLTVIVCGCGSRPQTAEVTGRITFDGKPQANVIVELEPQQPVDGKIPPAARGITDADGRYRVFRTGHGLFGVAVGPAFVRISAAADSGAKVHRRYAAGGLSLDVTPGGNVYDLDLPAVPGEDWRPVQASPRGEK